jgi:Phage tail assembly chaperone protein, TAC
LALSPATFWALSLPEWRAALTRLPRRAQPLARGELERMMKEFPDG